MPTIVIYGISTDPLGSSDVTVLNEYVINITDALGPTCLPVVTKHEACVALDDFRSFAPYDWVEDMRLAS